VNDNQGVDRNDRVSPQNGTACNAAGLRRGRDEFGYLRGEAFEVRFDSKQNFDENYEGNWY